MAIGGAVGRVVARARGPRTGVALRNLEIAFPAWSRAERHRTLVASFANVGRAIAEVALLTGRHREQILDAVRIEGLEHLVAAQRSTPQGGVILLTAHFGSWELAGAALARSGIPLSVVHHGFENAQLGSMVTRWRHAGGMQTLELGSAGLGAVRALRRGRVVAMLFDQNAGRREGRFAPFFGLDASTRAGPALLAMRLGIPVVPAFFWRVGEGPRHVARFLPALEIEPAADDAERSLYRNLCRMNGAIEAAVREAPDQWTWIHKRWKTRPEGELGAIYLARHRLRRRLRQWLARAGLSGA
ncbi:MAG: lysophospholipid acyltransferase family protein [Deltaproteobacteria bacterium]|nr:lysophospholipid acyltransferase family protein [Deltaproteobacteria bacterium]